MIFSLPKICSGCHRWCDRNYYVMIKGSPYCKSCASPPAVISHKEAAKKLAGARYPRETIISNE